MGLRPRTALCTTAARLHLALALLKPYPSVETVAVALGRLVRAVHSEIVVRVTAGVDPQQIIVCVQMGVRVILGAARNFCGQFCCAMLRESLVWFAVMKWRVNEEWVIQNCMIQSPCWSLGFGESR